MTRKATPMRRSEFAAGIAVGAVGAAVGSAASHARAAAGHGSAGENSTTVDSRQQGGHDIRVRLFGGRRLIRADVTGADSDGNPVLFSFDADTTFKPTAIGGGVALTVSAYDAAGLVALRRYAGRVTVARVSGGILIVNTIGVEAYTASVLAVEISPSWAPESLKAQAIAIRTYALHAAAKSKKAYDLGDDTSSQVYHGMDDVPPQSVNAAQATAGLALFANDSLAEVFYSAACGGHTASSQELTGAQPLSYLGGVADLAESGTAYCAKAPYFAWQNVIPAAALERIFGLGAGDLAGVAATAAWPDGRVKTLRAANRSGSAVDMDGREFYGRAGSQLGYKVVPSTLFQVAPDAGGYRFTGRGIGHGIGMCQWGARGRADAGMNAGAILAAYFPGTAQHSA